MLIWKRYLKTLDESYSGNVFPLGIEFERHILKKVGSWIYVCNKFFSEIYLFVWSILSNVPILKATQAITI